MKFSAICIAALSASKAFGFQQVPIDRVPTTLWMTNTPEENRAEIMSAYFAKAHEEKLKAIADVEAKKNQEIAALKAELAELQNPPAAAGNPNDTYLASLSPTQLIEKLKIYQDFMADYIVKSHEQKYQAVKETEKALNRKWEEKVKSMMASASQTDVAVEEVSPAQKPKSVTKVSSSKEQQRFAARNQAVKASAAAGKSRWGDMEVEKATKSVDTVAATTGTSVSAPETTVEVPPEVVAADHGLRADGGVGGLTLAERVAHGVNAGARPVAEAAASNVESDTPPAAAAATLSKGQERYAARNQAVQASAAAGKSRWGDMEVQKAIRLADTATAKVAPTSSTPTSVNEVPTIQVPPEVVAADHGLRADGGVGGLSLAERVSQGINAGARAVAAAASASTTAVASFPPPSQPESLYHKRNEKVLAEAAAGKSRWGDQEIEALKKISSSRPSSKTPPAKSVKAPTYTPPSPKSQLLYQLRNAKVIAEAAAGKSRWGEQEIQRVRTIVTLPDDSNGMVVPPAATTAIPPEVIAADHGLRADGGVGGPTLAERIAQGSHTSAKAAPAAPSVYERRNSKVVAEAAAGKSRWGTQEVERVQMTIPEGPLVTCPDKLYEQRNVKVLAEAAAGKSRWGSQEIQKIRSNSNGHLNGHANGHVNGLSNGQVTPNNANFGASVVAK